MGAPAGLVGLPAGLPYAGIDPTTAALLQKDPNMAGLLMQYDDKQGQAQGQVNGSAPSQPQSAQGAAQPSQAAADAAAIAAAQQAQLNLYQNLTQPYVLNNG